MQYVYSASNNSFYPVDLKGRYQSAGTWPDDGVKVDESVFTEFSAKTAPFGMNRVAGSDGLPLWQKMPPVSIQEMLQAAEQQKARLLMSANAAILPLADAVDLGIATDEEKLSLTAWKTYRVLLNRVDITSAPDVDWPSIPQA